MTLLRLGFLILCAAAGGRLVAQDLLVASFFGNGVRRFHGPGSSEAGAPYPSPAGTGAVYGPSSLCRRPWGIAFGPDGDLYVTNQQGGDGGIFRLAGPSRATPGAPLPAPGQTGAILVPEANFLAIAFRPSGGLLAAYSGDVLQFDRESGAAMGPFTSGHHLAQVAAMAFGPDGHLYVAQNDDCVPGPVCTGRLSEIDVFDGEWGTFRGTFAAYKVGGLDYPYGLTFGPDGDLYVANLSFSGSTTAILRFAGPARPVPGTPLPAPGQPGAVFIPYLQGIPLALAFGPDRDLYVSVGDDSGSGGNVVRYRGATGALVSSLATVEGGPRGLAFAGAPPAVPPGGVELVVPAVMDIAGVPPAHFRSDLDLVNRGGAATRLDIAYLPAPASPGAGTTIRTLLGAGGELRLPDLIGWLRENGAPIPAGASTVGSLRIRFLDVADSSLVFAGSRTTTRDQDTGGAFGVHVEGVDPVTPAAVQRIVGLREDAGFRSHLGLVDLPGGTGPPRLSIRVFDGNTGIGAGEPLEVGLAPGEWRQLDSILRDRNVGNGWALVSRTGGGTDTFLAWGVVNDGGAQGGGTSDGTFLAPDAGEGLLPIVVRVRSAEVQFVTDVTLTNTTTSPADVALVFTPSSRLRPGPPLTAQLVLGPGRQVLIPDFVAWIRALSGDAAAESDGGTVMVSGASAIARVWAQNPGSGGGTFGVGLGTVSRKERATTEAWVSGLRQDETTRSNLAIADARVGDPSTRDYTVELFDPAHPAGAASVFSFTLAGGDWMQLSALLGPAGLSTAYARVRAEKSPSDFVVYGVVNDGSRPGRGTSDGSLLRMRLPSTVGP